MNQIAKQEQDLQPFTNSDNPITTIARLVSSGASTEIVQQMMALVDWDTKRNAVSEFNAAFSNAKRNFKKAKQSGYNKHLQTYYSLLEDYDEATKEALSEFGMSWRHVPATLPGDITSVKCILAHKSGHYEQCEMQAPSYAVTNNAINKMQAVGIVNTYLRRMTLSSMLGLVSDSESDNDGNGGGDYITDQQAADLNALAEEVDASVPDLLEWLAKKGKVRIQSLPDIPANMHHEAVSALNRKRAKASK